MSKIVINATVPDELIEEFLLVIRNFDTKHHMQCVFQMMFSTDLSTTEMLEAIEAANFEHVDVFQFKKQESEH